MTACFIHSGLEHCNFFEHWHFTR